MPFCTPRTCSFACHEGSQCTSRSCLSACRGGTGCTSRRNVSPCRGNRGCTPRSRFSAWRGGRECTPRRSVSACRGGRGCTPRSCFSASREDRGYTPCTGVSASREGRGCTSRRSVSACREGTLCSPRSCLSACRGGKGCTPRSSVSRCRGATGYTPRRYFSAFRASTAYVLPLFTSRRAQASTLRASRRAKTKSWLLPFSQSDALKKFFPVRVLTVFAGELDPLTQFDPSPVRSSLLLDTRVCSTRVFSRRYVLRLFKQACWTVPLLLKPGRGVGPVRSARRETLHWHRHAVTFFTTRWSSWSRPDVLPGGVGSLRASRWIGCRKTQQSRVSVRAFRPSLDLRIVRPRPTLTKTPIHHHRCPEAHYSASSRTEPKSNQKTMGAPASGGFDTSKVWSPSGGWFADPKRWKRNTLLGFAFLGVASATIFNYSRKLEVRPLVPTRRIPSQTWCANFPEGSPAK